jgi:hypothetical protein
MRAEKEIREEIRRVRERAKLLSGFWIAELATAAYSLEWALAKHDRPPSEDIGASDSAQGRIAVSLVKAAEKQAASAKKAPAAKKPKPASKTGGSLRRVK